MTVLAERPVVPSPPSWRSPAVIALGVVAVLLLGSAVFLFVQNSPARTENGMRASAVAAASEAAVNLTTIDFNTAEADVKRVLDSSTGDFAGQFGDNSEQFIGIVKKGRVVTTGSVLSAGVDKVSGDGSEGSTVRVLLAVRSTVQNTETQTPQPRDYRMAITEQLISGRWLAAEVEFVP